MIKIDITKCTGCKRCETACSFHHTGKVNNHLSRIKVLNIYETGIDYPVVCQQCEERFCLNCPSNAITIGSFSQILISPTNCNLCGACENNCPIGAIEIFNDIVYVCDLCGGNPKCVLVCTEGAISFQPNSDHISLAYFKKESKNKTPSEKRYNYVVKLGEVLQKIWRGNRA